jgi:hypothetical protein
MSLDMFDLHRYRFLQNPLWYVVTVTGLTILNWQFGFLWWAAGLVAVVWGLWLVWHQFTPRPHKEIHDDQLQGYLHQTLIYKTQLDRVLRTTPPTGPQAQRQALADQVENWTVAIQALVERIVQLREDRLIRQDLAAVPQAVETLQVQLAQETDPEVRAELERTLAHRQNQLAALGRLQNTLKRAECQVENTLSLLGTIYSQILTDQSTHQVADYSRLAAGINEEVLCLQDYLEALWEVKGNFRARLPGHTFKQLVQPVNHPD